MGVSAAESHSDLVGPLLQVCPWEQVSQLSSHLWACGQCSVWGWAMGWFSLNLMLLLGHLATSLKFPSKL